MWLELDSGELLTPLVGNDAEQYVDSLEKYARLDRSAAIILDETCKEQEFGLIAPFRNRSFFDKKNGKGKWRTLKGHTVHQADRERPIDDGRAGRNNACSDCLRPLSTHRVCYSILMFLLQL